MHATAKPVLLSGIQPTGTLTIGNYIALLDDPDTLRQKIRRAVTDHASEIRPGDVAPAVSNLLTILSGVTDEPLDALHARYAGAGYGRLKQDLAEAVVEFLRPIQERYEAIAQDGEGVRRTLRHGAHHAQARARETISRVYEVLGLLPADAPASRAEAM